MLLIAECRCACIEGLDLQLRLASFLQNHNFMLVWTVRPERSSCLACKNFVLRGKSSRPFFRTRWHYCLLLSPPIAYVLHHKPCHIDLFAAVYFVSHSDLDLFNILPINIFFEWLRGSVIYATQVGFE